MNLQLHDKIILVSGGAKGIGLGICQVLAAEGAIPVIVGRKEADNQQAVTAIEQAGGRAFAVTAELSDPETSQQAVATILEQFGRLDGLVNNAGANDGVGLEYGDYSKFMASLHQNLVHYYLLAHYALPALKISQGAIVNISFQDRRDRTRRHFCLRRSERRPQCADPRVGRRIIALQHPGKCHRRSRMLDTFVRAAGSRPCPTRRVNFRRLKAVFRWAGA